MLKYNENQVRKLKYQAELLVFYGLNCPSVVPAFKKKFTYKVKDYKAYCTFIVYTLSKELWENMLF